MIDWKNEVAGVVAILGFLSLVLAVTGVTGLLDVVVGSGNSVVVLVTGSGGTTAAARAVGSEGGVLGSAVLTAFGVVGLLATHSAIHSGYFDPADATADAGGETAPPETGADGSVESESDAGAA